MPSDPIRPARLSLLYLVARHTPTPAKDCEAAADAILRAIEAGEAPGLCAGGFPPPQAFAELKEERDAYAAEVAWQRGTLIAYRAGMKAREERVAALEAEVAKWDQLAPHFVEALNASAAQAWPDTLAELRSLQAERARRGSK